MKAAEASASSSPRRRSSIRPTPEGLGWLLISLLLLYQGWLRGINLVVLLASLLVGLWVLNLVWVLLSRRLKRLEVRRRVVEPVFAGQPFTLEVEVENPTRENQRGIRLMDQGPHHQLGWMIPVIRRGEIQRQAFEVTLPKRGAYRWPTVVLMNGYPFGLLRRTVRIETGDTVVVLPRLGRLMVGRLRRLLLHQPRPTASTKRPILRHAGAQTEFYGLREFRSGDSPRWIHWRTTARMGELMVREFEEPPVDHIVVILEPWLPQPAVELERKLDEVRRTNREIIELLLASGPPPSPAKRRAKEAALARKEEPFRGPLEALEQAVSLAATICWEWCRQTGARIALATADNNEVHVTETGMRQVFPLLETLALVSGATQFDVEALLQRLERTALPPGPMVLVTTRGADLASRLSRHLRRPVFTLDVTKDSVRDVFQMTPSQASGLG